MIDYYKLLGVAPNATLADIKAAFRRKAMAAHPDRGGSHEEMTRLNEAWEVLSDAGLRAAYDEVRGAAAPTTLANWHQQSEGARRRAQDYPRNWAAFEDWLGAVGADVRRAEYGVAESWFYFPTAGQSVSGWVCITSGAIALAAFCWTTAFYRDLVVHALSERLLFPLMLYVSLPATAGGWIGYHIHRAFRDDLLADDRKRERRRRRSGAPGAGRPPRVVSCGGCGKRLRVPSLDKPLKATCPACGDRITVEPT